MWTDRVRPCRWLLLLAVFLSGCVPLRPYHTKQDRGAGGASSGPPTVQTPCYRPEGKGESAACVRFVEYDDFGNLFNRTQLDETVEAARRVAEAGGIVVVYVHGWEHNASEGDKDLRQFHQAMQNAQALDIQYGDTRRILGIYVGWRGKSISVPGLSKATFWERKTTAQSVGDGAVFELFRKLANHRDRFPDSRLVLVGHSFGAAVTYASVSHAIIDQVIDDINDARPRGGGKPIRSKRWDMVVLVNPAFEAMQVRPHIELARSGQYLDKQLPHLIIITSQADWATRVFFPLGRFLRSTLNKYADPASPDQYQTAIGHYLPYITHQLDAQADCTRFVTAPVAPNARDKLDAVVESKRFCFGDSRAMLPDSGDGRCPQPVVLTRCDEAGDCRKVAGKHAMKAPPHMPIWNIRTTSDVMTGHGDIWNPTMQGFLVQLMVYIVEGPQPLGPPFIFKNKCSDKPAQATR